MSCGLRWESLSASTPTTDQVEGMNCIGPTARSYFASESYWPASVSAMVAMPLLPSRAMPKIPGVATPSAFSVLPLARPWLDSTRPIAATSCQDRLQVLSAALMTVSARWYAERAAEGMPLVEAVETIRSALPSNPGASSRET